jgi:hypothetical protein
MLVIENDIGHTILKVAPEASEWSWRYRRNNPLDTDAGRYPQNLFRLLTKNTVGDADVSASFEIRAINMTDTPNRDTWSGIFVMTRYQDADNLYYAGLRQDGHAVIKKKVGGVYYTLGEVPHFQSHLTYNKYTNPNLIPGQSWMRLKVRTEAEDDGMHITLFIDQGESGEWQEILSAVDTGTGGKMHSDPGHVGIRTDYMDVAFDDFVIDIR